MKNKVGKLFLLIMSVSILLAFSSCGLFGDETESDTNAYGKGSCPECRIGDLSDWIVTEEPTCTKRGKKSRICPSCGYSMDVGLLPTGHIFGEWTVDIPATCGEKGKNKCKCKYCDAEATEIVQPTGEHTYDKTEVIVEATCKIRGLIKHTCTVCDHSYNEDTSFADHSYGEWSIARNPNCSNEGEKERFCKWCNKKDVDTVPIDPDVHIPTGKIIEYIKRPNCIEEGEGLKKCYYCQESVSVVVEKLDYHDYGDDYKVLQDPTCTENGRKELTCKDCRDTCEDAIPAPGHTYDGEWKVTKEPTCAAGSHERVCDVCGAKQTEAMPAVTNEHTYGEWTLDISATCGANGREIRVCEFCNDEQENILLATGRHRYGSLIVVKEPTCTEEGLGKRICSRCNGEMEEEIGEKGHSFGQWTVAQAPACAKYGTHRRTCIDCDLEETVADIEPTGNHTYGAWSELDRLYHQHTCEVCNGLDDAPHTYENGICTACGYELPEATSELVYELNDDKKSYSVSAVGRNEQGSFTVDIVIPDYYDDGVHGVHPVTGIKSRAFNKETQTCSWMNSIKLPDTLEFIEHSNFYCARIERLVIPDSVKTIGANCFRDTPMRTLEIGAGLETIGGSTFSRSPYLEKITVSSANTVFRSQDNCLIKGNVIVKSTNIGYIPTDSSITTIGSGAYDYLKSIKEVVIPKNITLIDNGAFSFCTELSKIKIHSEVKVFDGAFNGSSNVTEVEIPAEYVRVLPQSGLSKVEKLVINSGTKLNDVFPLKDFTALTSVTIVNTVTEIPESMFEGCSKLSQFVWGNKITKIGANAFKNCTLIEGINLPSGLTEIGDGAFEGCNAITEIVIPDSVKILGKRAFYNCKALAKVTVGSGVTRIDNEAFRYGFMTEVTLKEGIKEIGEYAFNGCDKLLRIRIPDSVTVIEKSAFQGCSSLTAVDGCAGVTEVKMLAFGGCAKLTTISFGNKLAKIGSEAFLNNKNMESLNYAGTKDQWRTQMERASDWAKGSYSMKIKCLDGQI